MPSSAIVARRSAMKPPNFPPATVSPALAGFPEQCPPPGPEC